MRVPSPHIPYLPPFTHQSAHQSTTSLTFLNPFLHPLFISHIFFPFSYPLS
ncbi:hypothetical protein NBO_933g0003 [Nosema bombycis CQ1]|uniref:Uncharacterized protein n=1 Tax=Nosema bombycis (strain CQ1 / CVCC 102059) TaxID=578461 RepID=R0M0Y9_NOSB1|nr:hypothetical protein NBO_933g0003 [Nosema bombycis CQ1]|eukprot:EOB11694.1 hypothetical protein NBO_933g0003 [Nosema bombycis CQ1]